MNNRQIVTIGCLIAMILGFLLFMVFGLDLGETLVLMALGYIWGDFMVNVFDAFDKYKERKYVARKM